jgi:hypothetical protein
MIRRNVDSALLKADKKANIMVTIEKKNKWGFLSRLLGTVRPKPGFIWYPSNRGNIGESCLNNTKTAQLPPLMVRKAAWRR